MHFHEKQKAYVSYLINTESRTPPFELMGLELKKFIEGENCTF